jgi:hypothetical protein
MGVVRERVIPVGGEDRVQARHCVPLQSPESHLTAPGEAHAPFVHVDWAVAYPAEHDGPAPQAVPLAIFVALHTGLPVEQSVVPVWQAVLMPSVQAVPALQALQVPTLSQTPAVVPMVQEVATGSRLQIPVEQVRQVPQAVAQQTPEIQLLCVHWAFPEQVLPSSMVGVQAPPGPQ